MADTANVLVVANQTAGSTELVEALKRRSERGPVRFHLLVPATPRGASWIADMHAGMPAAEHDLEGALERLRAAGLEVEGNVGDPDPVAAVEDAVNFGDYSEVIVSTLPRHLSKWLRLDLPHRVGRVTGLPVTHVEAKDVKASA